MGNKQKFETELLTHLNHLRGYAWSLTRDDFDAEDLVNDIAVKALRFWDKFELGTNMRGWLVTMCYRTFVMKTRRKRIVRYDNDAGKHLAAMTPAPDSGVVARDIARSLDLLSPRERDVVREVLFEGCKYAEAGAVLGYTMKQVKSSLHKARVKMKKSIEGEMACPI